MGVDEVRDYLLGGTNLEDGESDSINETAVYKRRWWMLLVFSMACLTQTLIWDTWGPIAESSELVFGWTDATVAQITNMSSILMLIFVVPISSFMDTKGLKTSLLLCSALLFLCTILRCFTMEASIFTPMAYICHTLHGIATIVPFSGPALFASVWFPVKQRTMVSGILSSFNLFGMAITFILGPKLVPGPLFTKTPVFKTGANEKNFSTRWNSTDTFPFDDTVKTPLNSDAMESGIRSYMYTQAVVSGITFILVIVYFPAKPPKPPSISASLPRTEYKEALKKVFQNTRLWIIVTVGSCPRGVVGALIAVLDVVVKQLGVTQVDAGWVGFWFIIFGSFARLSFTKIFDILGTRRKTLLVVMHVSALISSVWMALLCDGTIVMNLESLYISSILLSIFVNGSVPLIYELAAETAYPVGEGMAGGMYTLVLTVVEMIFFGVLSIPDIDVAWMTWSCVGSLIITLPLLIAFKDRNIRYAIDMPFNSN